MTTGGEPALVPELSVTDLATSLRFWCGLCGFTVEYERPAEGFAYLSLGGAHVMLDQRGIGRDWVTGPLEPPLGRGINLQLAVADLRPIRNALASARYRLFQPTETTWYRIGAEEAGVEQFLVTDPDGYLLRFQRSLGRRAVRR
ncbi:bleomycin resistance protein [Actinocatenispora sera]|uniref:Bleomycin resistance protein n=1 Tax=Actinocatenispora sera TaxID=390989 RepID=A0A810LCH9_9ACTN|nr:VOC family protein [Actinocatenispora sera]BCJ31946.1 aldoketomutase [Actinocatenispora sera]